MPPLHRDTSELGVEKKFGLNHMEPLGGKNGTRGPLEFPSVYTKIRCRVRYE